MPVYLTGSPVSYCCWDGWGGEVGRGMDMDMAFISMPVLIVANMDTDGGSGCE